MALRVGETGEGGTASGFFGWIGTWAGPERHTLSRFGFRAPGQEGAPGVLGQVSQGRAGLGTWQGWRFLCLERGAVGPPVHPLWTYGEPTEAPLQRPLAQSPSFQLRGPCSRGGGLCSLCRGHPGLRHAWLVASASVAAGIRPAPMPLPWAEPRSTFLSMSSWGLCGCG